ncbi:MAG: PorP/SprF family type IX secretion system membrane protein, partial [Cyclobacteriaceae bacterium]
MNNFLSALTARVIVLSVCFLLFVAPSAAQQGQVYNQFFMNPYIYNPAYAGVDGHGVVFAMYKQQWSKIDDGPSFMHASYHMPLKGGIGFGVAGFRDTFGPLTTSAGKASASYLVNIDRKHFLRLGMSLGMGTNQIILPEDASGDPAFAGSSSSHLIGEFGATYHFDHFNIGFSMPNLFSSELVNDDGSLSPINLKPTDRMLFKMNYRGHINHEFAIEPHILYRYSSVLPSQFEVATVVHVKHIAWVGATYRQDAGMVGLLGMKIKQKFAVGAAFELGNSDFNSLTGSTYEIHIGMH